MTGAGHFTAALESQAGSPTSAWLSVYAAWMATCIPSNSAVDTLLRVRSNAGRARYLQLEDDNLRFATEDYRVISTDRGPVRGMGGGSRRL